MKLREFRSRVQCIIGAVAVAGLLGGCGGSSVTAPTSGGGSTGGSAPPPAVTGVTTPHSVSVVTAN